MYMSVLRSRSDMCACRFYTVVLICVHVGFTQSFLHVYMSVLHSRSNMSVSHSHSDMCTCLFYTVVLTCVHVGLTQSF